MDKVCREAPGRAFPSSVRVEDFQTSGLKT